MQCPKCGLESSPNAVSCDCGYSFTQSPRQAGDGAAKGRRGIAPHDHQPAASRNPRPALSELGEHAWRASSRHLDLAQLEKRYAEMSYQEFALLSREDLVVAAIPYYDREARRRTLPGPESQAGHIEIPLPDIEAEADTATASITDPEQILREAKSRRAARVRDLESLDYAPRSNQGPLNVVFTYRRMVIPANQRGDKLIVWLRRFHAKRPKDLRFDTLLLAACQGLGFPLTLRDSTFKSSAAEALPRLAPFLFLWSCGLTAALAGWVAETWELFCAYIGLPILFFFLLNWMGYRHLDPATAREQTLYLILGIRDQRGQHGDDSVLIVHCDDSFWRETVQLCLTHASAVVIDVTEVSENVIWELKAALHLMAPESITLAQGLDQGDETQLAQETRDVLAAELGADGSDRVQRFFYPRRADLFEKGPWGTSESLEEELQERLAVAVAYSEYRRAFGSPDINCQEAGGAA